MKDSFCVNANIRGAKCNMYSNNEDEQSLPRLVYVTFWIYGELTCSGMCSSVKLTSDLHSCNIPAVSQLFECARHELRDYLDQLNKPLKSTMSITCSVIKPTSFGVRPKQFVSTSTLEAIQSSVL